MENCPGNKVDCFLMKEENGAPEMLVSEQRDSCMKRRVIQRSDLNQESSLMFHDEEYESMEQVSTAL